MEKPVTLTARNPEDLLAAVPCVLGFRPEESVVLLTFGAPGSAFHARVDLPRSEEDAGEVSGLLRDAARRNRVRQVVLVGYSLEAEETGRVLRRLAADFRDEGFEVIDVLRAEPDRWFALLPGRPGPAEGVPYDADSHPFAAQSVLAGKVTHASRAELAATVHPDEVGTAAVQAAIRARTRRRRSALPSRTAQARWLRDAVRRHVGERTPLSSVDVARLVLAIQDVELRDVAWSTLTRENAADQTDLWRDVVRRTPARFLAPPATLLAFAAWLGGHGALAWCALDRCWEADPDYSMAGLVAQALTGAMPPSAWEPIPEDSLSVLRDIGDVGPGDPAA
jgi:hypothetical protein